MLYLLFGGTVILLFINFLLSGYDYLHPAFIYCLVFGAAEFACILGQQAYEIVIHPETIIILFSGEVIFTVLSWLVLLKKQKTSYKENPIQLEKININPVLVGGTILLQLLAIIFFIKYLRDIAVAYDGVSRSLTELISLYDVMTKFWTDIFNNLHVPVPIIYRIANPLVNAAAYIIIYVVVNNFLATGKIKISYLAIIGLQCILIILNGSRSPLFRILTMILMLVYIMQYRRGKVKKGNIRLLFKLVAIVICAAVFFLVLLNLMGRSGKGAEKIAHYLFVYIGAPIVNLDNFIVDKLPKVSTVLFGEQTFRRLYNYVGKLFGIAAFSYGGVNPFVFSANGIEIGNVFTTYYYYIYDFGFWGVVPLTIIVACYYVVTYSRLLSSRCEKKKINLSLLFYAYLFNDLIMQFFSSRFYETVLDAPFIKLVIVIIFFDIMFIEHKISLGKYYFKIPKTKEL